MSFLTVLEFILDLVSFLDYRAYRRRYGSYQDPFDTSCDGYWSPTERGAGAKQATLARTLRATKMYRESQQQKERKLVGSAPRGK